MMGQRPGALASRHAASLCAGMYGSFIEGNSIQKRLHSLAGELVFHVVHVGMLDVHAQEGTFDNAKPLIHFR